MDIKNFSDLSKLAAVCRKKGIETVKISSDSIEFTLSKDLPEKRLSKKALLQASKADKIESDPEMTDEELLLWSSPSAEQLAGGN